ncbi:MAG: helix-turn-helix transcriptional regulator [Ruminococcus sp.]|nr:helix-turn-helix transcriptional regulator [uncultured Ruminococcus sp.]MBQ4261432.1 helix-turn-helix transcriptional regulator [Ruminococcus sp.]
MYKKLSEESKSNAVKNMSDNLVALRTMLHLTQAQLAEIMGVTRQTLVLYETGKRVMTWNTFLSLMFIFTQKRETRELLNILNIYTDEMKELYDNDNK